MVSKKQARGQAFWFCRRNKVGYSKKIRVASFFSAIYKVPGIPRAPCHPVQKKTWLPIYGATTFWSGTFPLCQGGLQDLSPPTAALATTLPFGNTPTSDRTIRNAHQLGCKTTGVFLLLGFKVFVAWIPVLYRCHDVQKSWDRNAWEMIPLKWKFVDKKHSF